MPWAKIVDAKMGYTGASSGATTPSVNTTGADLIVLQVSGAGKRSWTISDSKGNAWVSGTRYDSPGKDPSIRLYYCANPTVGSDHTFTLSGNNVYGTIQMSAWSGCDTSDPFEAENGQGGSVGDVDSLTSGAVAPASNNALLIGCFAGFADTPGFSCDPAFAEMIAPAGILGKTYSMDVAYYVQTTAGEISAEWSWSGRIDPTDDAVASITAFNAAAPSVNSADTAVSEAGDLVSIAATLLIPATANIAEGGDSLTALGIVASPITANIAIAEPNDIISSEAVLSQSGSMDVLDADDSAASSAELSIGADAMITEAGDLAHASGRLAIVASAALTESDDRAPPATPDQIALASIVEGNDSTQIAGALVTAGTGMPDEAADTVSATLYHVLQLPAERTIRFRPSRLSGRTLQIQE